MADTNEVKPCPCGKTPGKLLVHAEHDTPKYAYCYGDCCVQWEVEFRNDYKEIGGEESLAKATAAWNESPRAATPPADAALADGFQEWITDKVTILEERARHHHKQGAYDVVKSIRNDQKMFEAIAAALRARAVPDEMSASDLLDAFDAESQLVPIGEESETRGKSVYNWRTAIVREMRAMLAASKEAT